MSKVVNDRDVILGTGSAALTASRRDGAVRHSRHVPPRPAFNKARNRSRSRRVSNSASRCVPTAGCRPSAPGTTPGRGHRAGSAGASSRPTPEARRTGTLLGTKAGMAGASEGRQGSGPEAPVFPVKFPRLAASRERTARVGICTSMVGVAVQRLIQSRRPDQVRPRKSIPSLAGRSMRSLQRNLPSSSTRSATTPKSSAGWMCVAWPGGPAASCRGVPLATDPAIPGQGAHRTRRMGWLFKAFPGAPCCAPASAAP